MLKLKPLQNGEGDMRQPVYISTTLCCSPAGTLFIVCSFRKFPLHFISDMAAWTPKRCGVALVTCGNPCKKQYSEAGHLERPHCSTLALPRVDIDSSLYQSPCVFSVKLQQELKLLRSGVGDIRQPLQIAATLRRP